MSKIDSPSSNNSRTSSETSETQSVEENALAGRSSKAPQTSNVLVERSARKPKRMKDPKDDKEPEKRPPWRAVSISTLPKPDKNALLKAKLLDASRRMRAGKSSISVQTDVVPTKLMKEVNLGAQIDLILLREAGIMTDGSYMKKKQGSDEFILTYAVSTLTDAIQFANVSTQTLLPKIPEDNLMIGNLECDMTADSTNINEVKRKLIQQINKLRRTSQLNAPASGNLRNTEISNQYEKDESQSVAKQSYLNVPTLQSWHFELDESSTEPNGFQPYTISSYRPWKSFMPFSYEAFNGRPMGPQSVGWNILFLAIDELIQETNCLVDIIEDLGKSKIEVVEIPKFAPKAQQLPSDYWLPIIEQQEEKLKSMKKDMENSLSK